MVRKASKPKAKANAKGAKSPPKRRGPRGPCNTPREWSGDPGVTKKKRYKGVDGSFFRKVKSGDGFRWVRTSKCFGFDKNDCDFEVGCNFGKKGCAKSRSKKSPAKRATVKSPAKRATVKSPAKRATAQKRASVPSSRRSSRLKKK